MKKFFPSFIAVKRIVSIIPATDFNRTDLETAARTSLELGGFIQPLIVRRTGTELELTYEVISGHFQYHAACIARDIDYLAGETVGAYIIEPETETAIIQQLAVIPGNAPASEPPIATEEIAPPAPATEATTSPVSVIEKPVTKPTIKKSVPSPYLQVSFHKMTLGQLKECAKKKGISLKGDKRRKETYIAALVAA